MGSQRYHWQALHTLSDNLAWLTPRPMDCFDMSWLVVAGVLERRTSSVVKAGGYTGTFYDFRVRLDIGLPALRKALHQQIAIRDARDRLGKLDVSTEIEHLRELLGD